MNTHIVNNVLTQEFINIFNNKSIKINKKNKSIYKKLLHDIINSFKDILNIKCVRYVKEININTYLTTVSLFNVPHKNIRIDIKDKFKGLLNIQCLIRNTIINIDILITDDDFYNLNKFNSYIELIMSWFNFILQYTELDINTIKLYLFPSLQKKVLPNKKMSILSNEHCNTAVTTACNKNGSILIYRYEEWFKVLIHETFHLLCLDFSGYSYGSLKNKIFGLFPIKSDFLISETYAEFYANILNCCFYTYLYNKHLNIDKLIPLLKRYIEYEILFACFQVCKILNFMGLSYIDLYGNSDINISNRKLLYKEDTNVFPYYILKSILLCFKDEFLVWCKNNNKNILNFNKSPKSLHELYIFIKKYMTHKKYINLLKKANKIFNKLRDNNKQSKLLTTMRMCILDVI